jgi:hypothetical protein
LPALSPTETVVEDGSMAIVTKTVLPTAAVTPVCCRVAAPVLSLCVPISVGLIAATITMVAVPEDGETFPAASVAVAVMLWLPAVRALLVIE